VPELPEVETVVRSIAHHIIGQTIISAFVSSSRVTRGDHDATVRGLTGAHIEKVSRHGKQILVTLDRGLLYIHLGMTGNLRWNAAPGKYARAVLELTNGVLVYNDMRQFGRFEYYREPPLHLTRVGPDAMEIDFETFFARLHQRKSAIKPLLLNQGFISGVGNIYADEALFAARIHPRTPGTRISRVRARQLYVRISEVLQLAIEHRGSSISSHVDARGEPGAFQHLHSVYGRTGEPCLRCGTPIRRIVLGQRSTHYCPRCQRA
jgi:formamidopyrimidine-DNA glycosylase